MKAKTLYYNDKGEIMHSENEKSKQEQKNSDKITTNPR